MWAQHVGGGAEDMRDLVNNGDTWGYDRTSIPEQSQNVADMFRAPWRAAFAHNEHKGQSLYKLIDHLWRREKTANDCEPIICVRHDGKIYALGGDLPPAS